MQGYQKVDELMRPVHAAIKRHVKDGTAVTDIYNRAYEAVMEVQDALNVSAAVTAQQIAENAKNLQRAEAAEAQVAALQAALEEEGHRNAVFTACLHKAQNLYLEAHPDYPGWPDGAVNITWVLEAFDKERAEVKRLQTALAAANEDAERLALKGGEE
jgi:hypothetical protein